MPTTIGFCPGIPVMALVAASLVTSSGWAAGLSTSLAPHFSDDFLAPVASQRHSHPSTSAPSPVTHHEFVFARLAYGNAEGYGWPRWQADWPEAEAHFNAGLQRLTALDVDNDSVVVDLATDTLYDYPWLYAVEVGSLHFSSAEASRLREYLLRGGFLMVDDFHGTYEWQQFVQAMAAVFPERSIINLEPYDETFHVLYDLSVRQQIPGIRALMNGQTWEKGGRTAHWLGIRDDQGRLMVVINFNQDIGDAWEHADDPFYPEAYAAMAYRMGINYVMYALTH